MFKIFGQAAITQLMKLAKTDIKSVKEHLDNHVASDANPHGVTTTQIGAVPDTRTINGKTLSSDITLTAEDIGAIPQGTTLPSGGSVQSDLAENDPTNAAYVKNRLLYKETTSVDVVPETTFTDNEYIVYGEEWAVQEGKTYIVRFDDVEYECICKSRVYSDMPCLLIGNISLINASAENTQEPFVVSVVSGVGSGVFVADTETSHKVAVIGNDTVYHRLPKEYLPEGYGYFNDETLTLLPETNLFFNSQLQGWQAAEALSEPMMVGYKYTVSINGAEYTGVANAYTKDGLSCVGFGNTAVVGGEDTGEPFFALTMYGNGNYYFGVADLTGATAVKASLVKYEEEAVLFDERLIGDWVARKKLGTVELLPEITFEWVFDEDSGDYNYLLNQPILLEIGKEYTVVLNGNTYQCIGTNVSNFCVLYVGEQLMVASDGATMTLHADEINVFEPATIAIYTEGEVPDKIPSEYLPKGYGYFGDVKTEVTEVTKFDGRLMPEGVGYIDSSSISTDTLTFDGDMANKVNFTLDNTNYFVKICDNPVEISLLYGATVEGYGQQIVITEDICQDMSAQVGVPCYFAGDYVVICYEDGFFSGFDFPKGIYVTNTPNAGYVSSITALTDCFSVSSARSIHKLDPRLLPDGYGYREGEAKILLPETSLTLSDEGSALLDTPLLLSLGTNYTVVFNSIKYESIGKLLLNAYVYVGNIHLVYSSLEDTGEPFCILTITDSDGQAATGVVSKDNTFTISIEKSGILHKFDISYLPDELATEDYVQSTIDGKFSTTPQLAVVDRPEFIEFSLTEGASTSPICYGSDKYVLWVNGNFVYSTDGYNWNIGQIAQNKYNYYQDMCYANDKFVTIHAKYDSDTGEFTNYLAYSSDGITWVEETITGINKRIDGICGGNDKFIVSTSGGTHYYSEDLATWQEILGLEASGTAKFANGIFFLTGKYSTDGLEWTDCVFDRDPGSDDLQYLCYAEGRYIGIYADDGYSIHASVYSSGDGINWTHVLHINTANTRTTLSNVIYYEGKFTFRYNYLYHSSDGINWWRTEDPKLGDAISSIATDGKKLVARVRKSTAVSTDGVYWTMQGLSQLDEDKTSEVASSIKPYLRIPTRTSEIINDSEFITIDDVPKTTVNGKTGNINLTYSDVNALPASTKTLSLKNIGDGSWCSVCYGNGVYVAADVNGKIAYSTDGILWTTTKVFGNDAMLSYGDGKFVVLFSRRSYISEDGANWTETEHGIGYNPRSLCYGNGKFIATVDAETGVSIIIIYSEDGVTWSQVPERVFAFNAKIVYGSDKFVMFNNDVIYYSDDGIDWVEGSHLPGSYNEIAYGGGKFITNPTGSYPMMHSVDGITWTEVATSSLSTSYSRCYYGEDKFIAYSPYDFRAAYSYDGITWTPIEQSFRGSSNNSSVDICYGDDKFVMVRKDNSWYSYDGITWMPGIIVQDDADRTQCVALSLKPYLGLEDARTSVRLKSSTAGSSKEFILTVDDSGTISVTEVTE